MSRGIYVLDHRTKENAPNRFVQERQERLERTLELPVSQAYPAAISLLPRTVDYDRWPF